MDVDAASVDGQDVIHAAVQERPVVGHQQEPLFAAEIPAHQLPARAVEVVGGLVDEQEAVFPGKEHRQQQLGLLTPGQRGKRPVQRVLGHLQRRQFPQKPPRGHIRADARQQLHGGLRRVRHVEGEVVKAHAGVYRALIGVLPLQEPQQRGLAAPVSARQPQPPVGVELKADVFKDVVVAALVAEREVGYFNNGHGHASYTKKWLRETISAAISAHVPPPEGRA